jgi:hypothetical protein
VAELRRGQAAPALPARGPVGARGQGDLQARPQHQPALRQGNKQCDQIGRKFAHWVIVFFGHFFVNFRNSLHFRATFSKLDLCTNLDKNGLGYILGDFFTNSSGHTGNKLLQGNKCRHLLSG